VVLVIVGLYLLTPSGNDSSDFGGNEQITGSDNQVTPPSEKDTMETDKPGSESRNLQEELYAANFAESEDLEYLIDQQVRGRDDIIVVSPEDGYHVSEKVLFKWVSDSGVQVILKILNNSEDVLFKFSLTENELIFNVVENSLDPGLYYWKLEKDNQLVHLGKFVYLKVKLDSPPAPQF
jgi:hypothetical protein